MEPPKIIHLDTVPQETLTVSVICPMYNEGKKIRANIEKLLKSLQNLPFTWELILVNDGSTDESLSEASKLVEQNRKFFILTYRSNRGRGYAIRKGIEFANGDVIVVTESDLSWGQDIVERLLSEIIDKQLDVVVASPHSSGGKLKNIPFIRRFYTIVGNRVLRFLMPVKLSMYTGMTRVYRGKILKNMLLDSDGKELHLEIISKLSALGYRIGEIPAELSWEIQRKKRKSKFRAKHYILSHLTFGIGESPFFVLALISLFFLIVGSACGFYLLYLSFSGTPVSGRPLIQFSMLSVMVGLFMLIFGFLAQQNKRLERQLHRMQNGSGK